MHGAMAQNLTVTTQDSGVQFEGNWTVQESGYYKFTTQIGASVSLTFPGKFTLFTSLSFFYLTMHFRDCNLLARNTKPALWNCECHSR